MTEPDKMNGLVSVIMPEYNEEALIEHSVGAICGVLNGAGIPFELIIIDDGSTDGSWAALEKLCSENEKLTALALSRNFGKEAAIFAGLAQAKGDCCITIDSDLQHPPETMIEMYRLWQNNDLQVIEGKKNKRQNERATNRLFARMYYSLLRKSSGINLSNASDFKLLDRSVIDTLNSMPEKRTFYRAITGWVGFNSATVGFDVAERESGGSKWSLISLFKLGLDSITSFTSLPMHLVTFSGVVFFIFAFVLSVQSLYMKLSGAAVAGFTTVIILMLIIGSIIMISLGIIGVYLSKIYDEVKRRPKYLIKKKIGNGRD